MLDRFKFWLWHREIASRMTHPATSFMWKLRVATVYKPLFAEKGLQAVYDEHARHVAEIKKNLENEQSRP